MTLNQTLQNTAQLLRQSNIEDSLSEARILLGHVLNMSREEIFTQPEYVLNREQRNTLHLLVQRRLNREPSSYIIEHKEFYGTHFKVDRRVLIPRPETEILVEDALEYLKNRTDCSPDEQITIADIGTGCGAIAISIAIRCPNVKCYAIDISENALEIACRNAVDHHVLDHITFLQGNLLEPLPEAVDMICANPPYIKSSDLISLSPEIAYFEPDIALDGGHDGLSYTGQLIKNAKDHLHAHGCAMIEIGQGQDIQVADLIRHFYKNAHFEFSYDLNHIKRVIKIHF
jgi:release factor glutamine methyltransferase